MEPTKTRTYLLYAVGEIALVMIGILLALQVNNWNEANKDRELEQVYLSELHSDFTIIRERSASGMDLYKWSMDAIEDLREAITTIENGNSIDPSDSLAFKLKGVYIGRVPAGKSPFYNELLSSGNLVILQNRELRRELNNYDDASRISQEVFSILRATSEPALHHTFKYISEVEYHVNAASSENIDTRNADIHGFLKDQKTPEILANMLVSTGNMYVMHRNQFEDSEQILKLIDQELEKKD